MKIYKYLCDPNFRNDLCDYLILNVPEVIECSQYDTLSIKEYNNPNDPNTQLYQSYFDSKFKNRGQLFHRFSIDLCNYSNTRCLCIIDDETDLNEISNSGWSYNGNLEKKFKNTISNFVILWLRNKKLKRILN